MPVQDLSNAWNPTKELDSIWKRILVIHPSSAEFINRIAIRIATLSPRIWEEMSANEEVVRRDNYLLRYVFPVAELAGWPIFDDNEFLLDALALQFIWQVCWRRLDDLLDSEGHDPTLIARFASEALETGGIHFQLFEKHSIPNSGEAHAYLKATCQINIEEKSSPIERNRIWERASLFLIVPSTLLQFSEKKLDAFCRYICADGLAHDVHDVFDDIARGIHSLPSSWFLKLDPNRAFRVDVLEKWFKMGSKEIQSAINYARKMDCIGPILTLLIDEIQRIANNLARDL